MRRNSRVWGRSRGGKRHTMPTQALRADVRPATQSCAGAPRPRQEVGFYLSAVCGSCAVVESGSLG